MKKKYLGLSILAWGGHFIYLLPYMRCVFYEPLQTALGMDHGLFSDTMTVYGMFATPTYWPGG